MGDGIGGRSGWGVDLLYLFPARIENILEHSGSGSM